MGRFRRVCRWLHRELGFLAVGLTLVYAVSGVVVNHVHHWNPNYAVGERSFRIEAPGAGETEDVAPLVLERLALDEPVRSTWRASPEMLQVFVEGATLDVDLLSGEVVRRGHVRRPFLYSLNFMHLNTGKAPWTGIADGFAAVLAVLAITGIFLVQGRRGLAGRGGVLLLIGVLIPLAYVLWERCF